MEGLCDRVALISEGKLLTEGVVKELTAYYGVKNLEELFIKLVGASNA
ncbi:MAG: hypothetical protein QW267_01695 [Sulfolobales archaeon]